MASTTLTTLWQRIGPLLGPFQSSAVAFATTAHPDPGRWLIGGTELKSEGAPPTWVGGWAYVLSLGVSVRIAAEIPEIQAFALDVSLGSAQAVSTAFDLSWPLPVKTTHGVMGLVPLIVEALHDLWFEDRIDLMTVADTYKFDLTAQAAWLDSEDRVLGLYDPPVATGYRVERADWRYDGLALDGGSPTLKLKRAYFGSGQAAQLAVRRPAHTLVNGSESTTGPSANADAVAADPDEIVAVALLKAYRYLSDARHLTDAERARFAALVGPQEAYVRANVRHYLPRDEMAGRAATAGAA